MKKIKNTYHKKLAFIIDGDVSLTLENNEEKKVQDELANKLLQNPWIIEIKQEKKIEEKPKEEVKNEIKKVGEITKEKIIK
jgi:hypothetical protein